MFSQTYRLFFAVPITWIFLFVCGLVWALDIELSRRLQIDFAQAQRLLGAESQLGLWDGAWWTVITTAVHHGGAIHLFLNVAALWMLGGVLETRLGSWRYALFCLMGLIFSGAVQSLWSPYVGISGMLCAQLGFIWAWHKTDTWLQTYVPHDLIVFSLISLFIGLPLAWLKIVPIGNAAHFAGLFYGYLAGYVYLETVKDRLGRQLFVFAHICLLPLLYFVVHPVWNANYYCHIGDQAKNPESRQRYYLSAIHRDPGLVYPWLRLAYYAERDRDWLRAWDYLIQCLQHNPSSRETIGFARRIWSRFPSIIERNAARQHLRQLFGENSHWEAQLLTLTHLDNLIPLDRIMKVLDRIHRNKPHAAIPPEPPIKLPQRNLEDIQPREQKLPSPDPDAPGSAEEGRPA